MKGRRERRNRHLNMILSISTGLCNDRNAFSTRFTNLSRMVALFMKRKLAVCCGKKREELTVYCYGQVSMNRYTI